VTIQILQCRANNKIRLLERLSRGYCILFFLSKKRNRLDKLPNLFGSAKLLGFEEYLINQIKKSGLISRDLCDPRELKCINKLDQLLKVVIKILVIVNTDVYRSKGVRSSHSGRYRPIRLTNNQNQSK